MRIHFALPILASILLSGCQLGSIFGQGGPKAAPVRSNAAILTPSSQAAPTPNQLGQLNGEPISLSSLPADVRARVRDIDNELAQRKLHLLWAGLEDVVNDRLIIQEAKARQLTTDQIIEQEIENKIKEPTEEDLKTFYELNQDAIGIEFENVRDNIRSELLRQQRSEAEMQLIGRLRASAELLYELPVPDFPRRKVRVDGAPFTGPKDAPITVVEFADFECPYCAQGHELLRQLRSAYPDQVKVVFRHFPLPQHQNARPAAEASVCAQEQGLFWQFHDILFEHTNALDAASLLKYAGQAGLDLAAFKTCLESDAAKAAVRRDEAAGREFGVDGTPSIYVNGIKLIGLLPLPLIRVIIDHELK